LELKQSRPADGRVSHSSVCEPIRPHGQTGSAPMHDPCRSQGIRCAREFAPQVHHRAGNRERRRAPLETRLNRRTVCAPADAGYHSRASAGAARERPRARAIMKLTSRPKTPADGRHPESQPPAGVPATRGAKAGRKNTQDGEDWMQSGLSCGDLAGS